MKGRKVTSILQLLLLLLSIPVGIFLVDIKTAFFSRAYRETFGRNANLVINLSQPYDISGKPWKNLAQGGEESDGMLGPVSGKVSLLEPEYIRIDHIYDFYDVVQKDEKGNLIYNWIELDRQIKTILDTGAKPFISLSYMPPAISSGSEVDIPNNWYQWREVVKETIEHISGKNELGIENVYYEVWNEPDLFGGFRLGGKKDYLVMYMNAALGAEDAVNTQEFKVGGPATTGLYENWFRDFLMYGVRNNLRIDFYSWHRYSMDIGDFEDDYSKVQKWIKNYPTYGEIEFIITEAGHDTENHPGYDGKFSAIHTISTNLAMFDKLGKVFQFEVKDGPGPEKYWGRWGILTHENFGEPEEKPRYHAIAFLGNIDRNKFQVFGQGTWVRAVASGRVNHIKVIIVNYDRYLAHSETVPITFLNLPSENFIYKRTDFMGSIREKSVSIESVNFWSTEEYMPPNSAALIEIIAR
jgi:hypothetical protein